MKHSLLIVTIIHDTHDTASPRSILPPYPRVHAASARMMVHTARPLKYTQSAYKYSMPKKQYGKCKPVHYVRSSIKSAHALV
jgi:hypothetical protein